MRSGCGGFLVGLLGSLHSQLRGGLGVLGGLAGLLGGLLRCLGFLCGLLGGFAVLSGGGGGLLSLLPGLFGLLLLDGLNLLGIGHLGAVLGNGLRGIHSLDLLDSAVGLEAQILGELLGLVGLLGDLLRGGLLGSGLLLGRGLTLGLGHAGLGHELHDDHGGVVALAGPELHDAGVAAGTILEHALGDLLEDLADELLVVQVGDGQTAGVQIAALGPGDHLVDLRADLLGTGLHRLDAVVQEQGGNQAALHSLSVAIVGTELATLLVVSHNSLSPKASN